MIYFIKMLRNRIRPQLSIKHLLIVECWDTTPIVYFDGDYLCNGDKNTINSSDSSDEACQNGDRLCNGNNNIIIASACEDGNALFNGDGNRWGARCCEDGDNLCNGNNNFCVESGCESSKVDIKSDICNGDNNTYGDSACEIKLGVKSFVDIFFPLFS